MPVTDHVAAVPPLDEIDDLGNRVGGVFAELDDGLDGAYLFEARGNGSLGGPSACPQEEKSRKATDLHQRDVRLPSTIFAKARDGEIRKE